MKNWTIEELYELWRDRGYSKKQAKAMAEKDYNEMHRKKSDIEKHQIMQEMVYNSKKKGFSRVRFPGLLSLIRGYKYIERRF